MGILSVILLNVCRSEDNFCKVIAEHLRNQT